MEFERMLAYCAALDAHNDRNWFHENHKQYEQARADFLELLELVRFSVAESAPRLEPDIKYMEAKDWMYRIARDMRYYHDRPPYEPSFRAYISRDRKSWLPIGYFLLIAPGRSCFGTGLWCRNTAETNLVRDYISAHAEEFEHLVQECPLPITGEQLKTMPRGYDEHVPAAQWLRYKHWEIIENIPDSALTGPEALDRLLRARVRQMEPLRQFFLEAATLRHTEKRALEDFYCR